MKRRNEIKNVALTLLALLVYLASVPSKAADTTNYTWALSANSTWSTVGNWSGSMAPPNGGGPFAVLLFKGPGYGSITASNNFSITPFVLNSLVLTNAGTPLTVHGGDLQFVNTDGGTPPTLNQAASQGGTISNNLSLATNVTAGGIGSGTVTLGGVISGDGSLTKNGSFLLALKGSNTFAGGTILNDGTLSLGNNLGLGTGSLTVSGGVLQASATVALTNDVIAASDFTVGGAANLSLNSLSFPSPQALVNANVATTVLTGTNDGAGTLFAQAGNLILSNAVNTSGLFLQAYGGNITLVGGGTFGLAFGTLDPGAVAGSLGTLTLNPAAAGATTFTFGDVTNGAAAMSTLTVNTGIADSTNVVNIGNLVRVGRSTMAVSPQNGLGDREQVSIAGGVDLVNGILPPWVVSTSGGGEFLTSSATWLTNAAYTMVWSTPNGTNPDTPTASDVVKVAAATTLTNAVAPFALNVQSGSLDLDGHTLTLGSGAYGGLMLTSGVAITNDAGPGGVALNAAEALVYVGGGNTATLAANLSGAGNLTKFGAGTLVLSNFTALHTGDTLIDAGALSVNPAQDYRYTNNINGAGVLVKDGSNVFSVVNSTGSVGGVTVNAGTLAFSGGLRNEQYQPTIAAGATLMLTNGVQFADLIPTNGTLTVNYGTLAMVGSTGVLGFATGQTGPFQINHGGTVNVGPGTSLAFTNASSIWLGPNYVDGNNTMVIGGAGAPAYVSNPATLYVAGQLNNGCTLTVTNATLLTANLWLYSWMGITNGISILDNGTVDLMGGTLHMGYQPGSGTSNYLQVVNGGVLTNVGTIGGYWGTYESLTVSNGGCLYSGSATIGAAGSHNTYNVGGEGARSLVQNGSIQVGATTYNQYIPTYTAMTITNADLYSQGATIGYGWGASAAGHDNQVRVMAGGYWNVGGGITLGGGNSVETNDALVIDAGIVTNVTTLNIGSQSKAYGHSVIITNGGQLFASSVSAGTAAGSNLVVVAAGGLLDANTLATGTIGGNVITNDGGIFQFSTAAPTITPNGNPVAVGNGTISFRGITNADVAGNGSGSQLTNMSFSGANAFRLNGATNAATSSQAYGFDPGLTATNYFRLDMVNGGTRYRGVVGDSLTIGQSVGSGGEMLCSNTAAFVDLPFTNNGTLTIVNSTLTFGTNAVLNGTVKLDQLIMSGSGMIVAGDLTLGTSSALSLTGFPTNQVLVSYGSLHGRFGSVTGLPTGYGLVYNDGTIAVGRVNIGSVITFR